MCVYVQLSSCVRVCVCACACAVDAAARVLEKPLLLAGDVVRGYGRGSSALGIPTANLDAAALGPALDGVQAGVYVGWASVSGSGPHKAVMSIG